MILYPHVWIWPGFVVFLQLGNLNDLKYVLASLHMQEKILYVSLKTRIIQIIGVILKDKPLL